MSDLPRESPAFEIRPRLNEEMEYFKEMALQETERWIEVMTKKRFKYPDDPRRSLQDGVLLCELVNALKPGSVRKINRLPTPIAFLDNLTVFQQACHYEFGLQECQLFDIKDLEDLSLRGVLESEEEIQYETSRRLKNVAITIFWLGKAVRHWYKGPMLDFSAFTDIIDMSHSSQMSFRTPSEASFVSAGRFSTDPFSSSRASLKQSELSYERVAKYLESKPYYGCQANLDYSEPMSKIGSQKLGSDFEEENFEGSVDSADAYHLGKIRQTKNTAVQPSHSKLTKNGDAKVQSNGMSLDFKTQLPDSNYLINKEPAGYADSHLSERTSEQKDSKPSIGSPVSKERIPSLSSPGTGALPSPLQFVKGDSSPLTENAKQTMELMKQQSVKHSTPSEDDDWEAKLANWKLHRRSLSKSQNASESGEETSSARCQDSSKLIQCKEKSTSSAPSVSSVVTEPTSPTKTLIKKREQEEETLAIFGFMKLPNKPATKPKSFGRPLHGDDLNNKPESAERSHLIKDVKVSHNLLHQLQPRQDEDENAERYVEKIIKISQRPKHHRGFGFTIKGGKEHGMPITVDKVHLGGAADVCDLMSKDEIVAINGAQLANHYLESVRAVIDQAVHCGQVELTIRRTVGNKCLNETEDDVFSEEEIKLNEDQNEDDLSEGKLLAMLELENARPLTPLPPEDEPPPLPSAPPPQPNWNTFPGSEAAFSPRDVTQYLDDEPFLHEEYQKEDTSGKEKPCAKTGEPLNSLSERRSLTSQSSESDKFEMLMKRIHFFGLKPEDSEELRKILEEKEMNGKQIKSETQPISPTQFSSLASKPKNSSIHSEERAFALVVKPIEGPPHPPETAPPSTLSSLPFPGSEKSLTSVNDSQGQVEHQEGYKEERSFIRKGEDVNFTNREEEMNLNSLQENADRNRFQADPGKQNLEIKTSSLEQNVKEEIISNRIDMKIQPPASQIQKECDNISRRKQEHRHSQNFPQSFEKSKEWKSMEVLRSISVSDPVKIDAMEKARAEYLSLMMDCPKLNLEAINRQYFDLDNDLKRMEEWNKKQEQLRKEKFDRDKEELQRKHETALKEATALESLKQKQEQHLLEKEMIWKQQLEEIQVEREKELVKKQKEEQLQMKLAAEKERKEQLLRMLSKEKADKETEGQVFEKLATEQDNKEMTQNNFAAKKVEEERNGNQFMIPAVQFRKHFEESASDSPPSVIVQRVDNVQTGRVEVAFIDSGPTSATLEVLPDSICASSESLCSSTQQECSVGDIAKSQNLETITNSPQAASSMSWGESLWGNERIPTSTSNSSISSVESKLLFKEKLVSESGCSKEPTQTVIKKGEPDISLQSIRNEALSISRRPGGGSHWSNPQPEDFSQPVQPEPLIRRSIPPPSNLASAPLQPQSGNRKLLQDFSAPPKHRLQDSESWITSRQYDYDYDEDINDNKMQEEVRHLTVPNRRTISGKPAVPLRTDSLKQFPSTASVKSAPGGMPLISSALTDATVVQSPDDITESLTVKSWQVGQPNSRSLQANLLAAPGKGVGGAMPYFNVTNIGYSRPSSYGHQVHGSLEALPQNLEHLAYSRSPGMSPVTQDQAESMRVQEVNMKSVSYNAMQQPRSRPYSHDYSSLALAPTAVPYHQDLHDLASNEPASEAVSMLFAYHQNPSSGDARQTANAPLGLATQESNQKCAGCNTELGFGRCIVLDSLEFCFHPECFECSVCRTPIQSIRDDIRILASKLHCRNCFTNEQGSSVQFLCL